MAEELRWVQLINTSASTTSETNSAISSFTNSTDENIFIRNIDFDGSIIDGSPVKTQDAYCVVINQMSKQIAYIATDGDTNWKQNVNMSMGWCDDVANTSISAGKHIDNCQKSFRFAKGQLTLEPNETLYIHDSHTNSGAEVVYQSSGWVVGYHF